jgi:hypothetical protein
MKASFNRLIPFLCLILRLSIPKTRLHSIPSSYLGRLASRNLTFHFRLEYSAWSSLLTVPFHNPSAWTTHKTVFIVKDACLLVCYLAVGVVLFYTLTLRGEVFTESLPNNGCTRHNNIRCAVFMAVAIQIVVCGSLHHPFSWSNVSDHDDWGSIFLRNWSIHLPRYTMWQLRRP